MDPQAERDLLLLALERQGQPSARAEAAEELCSLAAECPPRERGDFAPVVARLLADAQAEVRCAGLALAAEVLSKEECQGVFTRFLADADTKVRVEAAGRLADLAAPSARGALAAVLQDPAAGVRFEAARGMAELRHDAGLEELLKALGDVELRFRAAGALARLGNSRAIPALRSVFSKWLLPAFDRTQIAGALAALGDESGVAHLLKRTRKRRWSMDRAMAAELLGVVKAPGAHERLLEMLTDAEDPARGAAARALGYLGQPSAESALLAMLDEPALPEDLALDAAEGLLRLGRPAGRDRASRLTLVDPEARAELAVLLAELAESPEPP